MWIQNECNCLDNSGTFFSHLKYFYKEIIIFFNAPNFQTSLLSVCGRPERATYSLIAPLWVARPGLPAVDPGRPELLYQTGSFGLLFWALSEEVWWSRGYYARRRPKVACGEDVGRWRRRVGEREIDWLIEGKRDMARPLFPSLPAPALWVIPAEAPNDVQQSHVQTPDPQMSKTIVINCGCKPLKFFVVYVLVGNWNTIF